MKQQSGNGAVCADLNGDVVYVGDLGGFDYAADVSSDGSVVAGTAYYNGLGLEHALRWTQAGGNSGSRHGLGADTTPIISSSAAFPADTDFLRK